MVALGVAGELVVEVTAAVFKAGGGFHVIVESLVVPGRGAQSKTHLPFVAEVDFAKQVQAIGNHIATVERVIALVGIRAVGNGVIRRLDPITNVVANRVSPGQADIGVTRVDFERLNRRHGIQRHHRGCKLQAEITDFQ
ncbi:hypothetical protein D9M71_696740 [compost metagenome]